MCWNCSNKLENSPTRAAWAAVLARLLVLWTLESSVELQSSCKPLKPGAPALLELESGILRIIRNFVIKSV